MSPCESSHHKVFDTTFRILPQVVREHYLRDDISSGSPLDPECDAESVKLSSDAKHYLIVDTNVVLQQVPARLESTAPALCRHADGAAACCLPQQPARQGAVLHGAVSAGPSVEQRVRRRWKCWRTRR